MNPTLFDWIESLVLGVVQGITEFLPISSDGHLAITLQTFKAIRGTEGPFGSNMFYVVLLHIGTLAALIIHYRRIGWAGFRGLLGATDVATHLQRPAVVRAGLMTFVATLPVFPLVFVLKKLEDAFESPIMSGLGFLVTAAVLLLTTRLKEGHKGLDEVTWVDALLIGIAQAFAPLPGVSRSGMTIAAALGRGFSKTWAVGFSFLMAVPAILGGATLELRKVKPEMLAIDRLGPMLAGTVVAGIVGYAAIVWLVRVVRAGRLWYFSVYLIVLGAIVILVALLQGGAHDGRRTTAALDRPARLGLAGSGAERPAGRLVEPLDRADPAGQTPGDADPGPPARGRLRTSGLDLAGPLERSRQRA